MAISCTPPIKSGGHQFPSSANLIFRQITVVTQDILGAMPDAMDSKGTESFIAFRSPPLINDSINGLSKTPSLRESTTGMSTVNRDYASMDLQSVQQQPPETSDSNFRLIIRYLSSFIPSTITTSAFLISELEDITFGLIWTRLIGSWVPFRFSHSLIVGQCPSLRTIEP
ncbi:unnamed protein product [Cuscuta campestris]|uniref:Uncharacterized protein n=1 Tax=Cuscuta campestris TaxID=132261 RepID=A0A484LM17_9ASTE|nr:unnamed protein product [Cuscuta campestris]